MQLNFGSDIIWSCLRITSMRCNGNSANTKFGVFLEYFQWDGTEFRLRPNLELS